MIRKLYPLVILKEFLADEDFISPDRWFPGREQLHSGTTLQHLVEKGFHSKYKEKYNWTPLDDQLLIEAVGKIAQKELTFTVQSVNYFISHYIFFGRIDPRNISERVDQLSIA